MSNTKRITGTKEWAKANVNCIGGCENNCRYCYAQALKIRYKYMTKENKHIPVQRKWAAVVGHFKSSAKIVPDNTSRIMFPTTHDITPATLDYCLETLNFMLSYPKANPNILIVSKPNLKCIQKLCQELISYKDRIMFRFTIGSADDVVLKYWELNASSFAERVESLKYAFNNGYGTSVSCEPMLDDNIKAVVDAVYPYVNDSIWLGLANRLKERIRWNSFNSYEEMYKDTELMAKADELLATQSKDKMSLLYAMFKNDPKIKWKDELKKLLGLPTNESAGMDT